MLLDSKYTIIPQIRFTLTQDDGTRKVVTVKTNDKISCSYKENGERLSITGVVVKIGCNFNSSLGAVGTSAYLQIDGSAEYSGSVIYVKPSQVLDLTVISSTETVENIVCSVDNEDQRISLIRENEVGVFQYSLDGITWQAATGRQGMSAYECAVELGFEGTEEEWIESLKGKDGEPGRPGTLDIFAVFDSIREAECERDNVPNGKLVAVKDPHAKDSLLFMRLEKHCPCGCDDHEPEMREPVAKGYKFLGFLGVGCPGPQGEPGKSAYQYAVEGGYPGTKDDFIKALAKAGIVVTTYAFGNGLDLNNSVLGPIDLKIFGFTDTNTFISKFIRKINISSSSSESDQTLIFKDPIVLRAVPTDNDAAKPNLIINGQKYVSDCIEKRNGRVGVYRRIKYIESYSGQTIVGDWISSTGDLDLGAEVQYVVDGRFEPFDRELEHKYEKLHAYDRDTHIFTDQLTYISAVYPIDIIEYISYYINTYLDEHSGEIIDPIVDRRIAEKIDIPEGETISTFVERTVDEKIDIPEGYTSITEYVDDKVDNVNEKVDEVAETIGDLPTGNATVVDFVNKTKQSLNVEINKKQSQLIAGENITILNDIISSSANTVIEEPFTTTVTVGGVPAGTTIESGTQLVQLLKDILCPYIPPVSSYLYYGVSDIIPSTLDGLTSEPIEKSEIVESGKAVKFSANDQYLVFAFESDMGELEEIYDPNGFRNIDGWSHTTYTDGDKTYFIYYSKESLTITSYKLTFVWID